MADRAKRFFPKANALTFDTPSARFLAVKGGRANALQIDTPSAELGRVRARPSDIRT